MSMVTRCPDCGTGFRVSAGQLKAQHGTVRCGRCAAVFNAFDSLSTLPDTPAQAPAGPSPGEGAPDTEVPAAAVREQGLGDAAGQERDVPPEVSQPAQGFVSDEPVPRRHRDRAWAVGSGVLLLVLAAQFAYVFRVGIADALPRARPWLEQACVPLGCTVPYPRNIQDWSIESSDLVSDPQNPARMTLTAILRNRAELTQDFPALELTLTDTQDRPVARRVLGASEYLPPGAQAGPGLAANAEVTLTLALDTGDLNAAGYRLFLFYP